MSTSMVPVQGGSRQAGLADYLEHWSTLISQLDSVFELVRIHN